MTYSIIQQTNTQHAHIQFDGPFQGQTVTWNTHFFTFDGYRSKYNRTEPLTNQFIDITPTEESKLDLTVVLNIPEITQPNIQKMMIMIRQYKNLSIGRHQYG